MLNLKAKFVRIASVALGFFLFFVWPFAALLLALAYSALALIYDAPARQLIRAPSAEPPILSTR